MDRMWTTATRVSLDMGGVTHHQICRPRMSNKFICRSQNEKYVQQSDLLVTDVQQIGLSVTKREICPTTRFVGHGCPTNWFVGHEMRNMTYNQICWSRMSNKLVCRTRNGKYVQQSDLLVTDVQQIGLSVTKREICPTIRFVGHGCPTNWFVGHETRNMSNNQICRSRVSNKLVCRTRNAKYVQQPDLLVTDVQQIHLSDTKREICPTIRFVGHGWPTNGFVANETGNISNKSIC